MIRAARVEDAEAVDRVHEQASGGMFEELVGRSFDDVFPRGERLRGWRARLAAKATGEGILVAEIQGAVVGIAVWRLDAGGTGELEDLHVLPAHRGTGIAKQLLAAAIASLREAGASAPVLWVGETNGRARRFYEREGWSYDGTSEPSSLGPIQLRYRLTGGVRAAST